MQSQEANKLNVEGAAEESGRPRNVSRLARAIFALALLALGGFLLWSLLSDDPAEVPSPVAVREPEVAAPSAPPVPSFGVPVRLRIPALNVEAPVVAVGLTEEGAMDSPEGAEDTGWYELGPRPGEQGSAVIAGHSGYRTGPAVFDDLEQLEPGDSIYVIDDAGATVEFVVRESREYDPYERPEEVFTRNEGQHLNLITCTGSWDSAAGTHTKRLVVFADAALPYSEKGSVAE
jgi:LPXTG-site transpeptidase (sortase) family protein